MDANEGLPPDRALTRRATGTIAAAQSSVLFFEQVASAGFSAHDLQRLRAAVVIARSLFVGRMHASGKEYLAHGIGVASALVSCGAEIDVVIAGLLHGAYRWGDFAWWRPTLRLRRDWLRRRLGRHAEDLVHRFLLFPWSPAAVADLTARRTELAPAERTVLLLRLVSDLDNFRGGAALHAVDAEQRCRRMRAAGADLVALADAIGQPALAAALEAARLETLRGEVPVELRSTFALGVLLSAESSRRRVGAIAADWLRKRYRRGEEATRRPLTR